MQYEAIIKAISTEIDRLESLRKIVIGLGEEGAQKIESNSNGDKITVKGRVLKVLNKNSFKTIAEISKKTGISRKVLPSVLFYLAQAKKVLKYPVPVKNQSGEDIKRFGYKLPG